MRGYPSGSRPNLLQLLPLSALYLIQVIDNIDKIPINMITGFLGSGKTTVLNQLLSSPDLADTAVLVNEFGEIGVDHLLVKSIDEDIFLLESGCICCSVRDDFSASLLRLHARRAQGSAPRFQRVLLETTGIADPIAISELVLSDNEIIQRYVCRKILTVVDAVHGQGNLDKHLEAVKQVSVADHIVISKTDLCDEAPLAVMEERLRRLNPLAPQSHAGLKPVGPGILSGPSGAAPGPERQQLPRQDALEGKANSLPHDNRFATFSLTWPEAVAWDEFAAWLEAILFARGDSIHRVKGLLKVAGETRPTVIQGVQHSFYSPTRLDRWPDGDTATRLVFITSDFSKRAVINSLENILDVSAC
ncbi:MAG: GTP-binding protein [Gammaproteobacteria bacterium]|nr:GTP-binding protein [Gammaproteobacteria bacterium]MXW46031.1 GTP-binding protein [Gammaproteobacteria bacterium]MYD02695.1 GTP-binding protein [Gammaproteobacteria bacterium]MYI25892.1 GTP-binding protein [Gammaproteobacteria bacterium]